MKPFVPPLHSSLDELFAWANKNEKELWLYPRFRALLEDAAYFAEKAQGSGGRKLSLAQARYGRAAIIMSLAAIEAASNDVLVAICDLLGDQWPAECIDDPPWRHFRRLSWNKARQLLGRGRLERKVDYILNRITRETRYVPKEDFRARLRLMVLTRNRIVHMKSLSQPTRVSSILNANQVAHAARTGATTADEYVDLVEQAFSEMNLSIIAVKGS